ncbi:MAG: hypothetical protein V3T05_13845 [Myxococcota bacterium]
MSRVTDIITAITAVAAALWLSACVVEKVPLPAGPGSFRVDVQLTDGWIRPPGCEQVPEVGSPTCLRPFSELTSPVSMRVRATVLDHHANEMPDWNGVALVDVRPGELIGGDPGGVLLRFAGGVAEVDIQIAHAFGKARVWVEDCGSAAEPGSFATGVGPAIYFDLPRLDQLNATTDNTTSPMTPRATNVCAITGDPRYGLGVDRDGEPAFVGYSFGKAVNAPPPAMGTFAKVVGCSRDEYDALVATGGCERGPLVVTAIGNDGFYITDLRSTGRACTEQTDCGSTEYCDTVREVCMPGFNHLFAFTFNYPDNLEVGDVVVSMRGSPVEFSGSTQMSNPVFRRDGVRRGADLIPQPVKIEPGIYAGSLKTYGRNRSSNLDLEKLEGALVCFEGLAPAAELRNCDVNASGSTERQGCLVDFDAPLPPRCDVGIGTAPSPPLCNAESSRPYCMPMTADELAICNLKGYLPNNPAEYCCERICWEDLRCNEASSYIGFGQWVADVYGRYEPDDSSPVKIAVITRDANPDFDPLAFGAQQRSLPVAERQRVRIIGNLRHVLAARPVWVVTARGPADIEIGGSCP